MRRIFMRLSIMASVIAMSAGAAQAQERATLQGRVIDAATGDGLIGAQVAVTATDQGTVTDVDGRYRLSLAPGLHDLSVVYLGYAGKTVTGVRVFPEQANVQDISLQPEMIGAETITVVISAEAERGSVIGALARQRKATNLVNGISAEEISRGTAGNAAEAIERVTSTSIVGGKYVYIRGLGERYSSTLLDGAPLPTPEPEKRVLPLDIFPTSMIESLFAVKSYTADLPGDFTGGLVDIRTKDIPVQPFFAVTTGVGYSTNLADMSRPRYEGGGLDWLGFDDGTRSLPDALPADVPRTAPDQELAEVHSLFEGGFQAFTDPMDVGDVNTSFGLSFGAPVEWLDREGGYTVGVSYSNNVDGRVQHEFYPSLEAGNFQYDYDTSVGTRQVSLGALAGYSMNTTPTSRLSLKTLFTQTTEDETRLVRGPFNLSSSGYARIHRFQFVERSLLSTQLDFEHEVGTLGDSRLTWSGSYGLALRDEPDTRTTFYVGQEVDGPFRFNESGSNDRFFSELTDHQYGGEVKLTSRFDLFGIGATLETGGRAGYRTRAFAARRFSYDNVSREARTLSPSELFTSARIAAGDIDFFESTDPTDQYDATERSAAGYASLGASLSDRLRTTVGLRLEWNETEVVSFDPRTRNTLNELSAHLSTVEPLPTVTVRYELGEDQSIHAAAARTIVRPQFRELAPFAYQDYLETTLGNPFLENGESYNFDLRWSWFPSLGEIVSVGGFYKMLNDPIETVRIPTAGTNVGTPEPYNGPSARTYGVELELRNELSRWTPLAGLTASTNVTLAASHVEQDEPIEVFFGNPAATEPDVLNPELFTNGERDLFYQSPYLVNASLHYVTPSGRTSATLLYDLIGERLTQVGTRGYDDIVEQSRQTFDISAEHRLMNALDLKLTISNLSNEAVEFRLGDVRTLSYEPGRTMTLKATYSF